MSRSEPTGKPAGATTKREASGRLPLEFSIGAAVRRTHRSFTQQLERYLSPHGIPLGAWYFLRALWEEDGLTQHELSQRVGTVDPTAVLQLRALSHSGFVVRRRSAVDRRKLNIYLTSTGRALREQLEPFALAVNQHALAGLTDGEVGFLRMVLERIRKNLLRPLPPPPPTPTPGVKRSHGATKKLLRS